MSSFRRCDGPRWSDPYYREWSVVVGDRIRRLRKERDWALKDLCFRVWKPEGGHYSIGYFSRLERGWSSAPLYVYLTIADALEVDPGILLGPDEVQRKLSGEQAVLLRFLESAGIDPGEAIARLSGLVAEALPAELAPRGRRARVDADGVEIDDAAAQRTEHERVAAREQSS